MTIRPSISLFIIYLGLKLADAVDWSWWWVTCPLWIDALFHLILFVGLSVGRFANSYDPNSRTVFAAVDSAAGSNMIKLNIVTK